MDHTVLDFLAEGCLAGKTLLRMVARANAIIAEVRGRDGKGREGEGIIISCFCFQLLRLSEHIPPVFEGSLSFFFFFSFLSLISFNRWSRDEKV